MKTTKFFLMAALALTFAACSNDDNDILNPAQPAKGEGITITATLAPKDAGATTREVSEGTNEIVTSWDTHESIAILYTVGGTKKRSIAAIKSVDASGTATIEFTVASGTPDNTECTLVYPYTAAKSDYSGVKDYSEWLASQWGNLTVDFDVRVGTGKIQTTTPSLDVTTQPKAQYSIFKFTIKNSDASANINVNSLTITIGTQNYVITPDDARSTLYAALPPVSGQTVSFSATGSDSKTYTFSKDGVTFAAGNFYQSTLKMAVAVLNITSPSVGQVIGSNGKNYAYGSLPTGVTAVAKICYVSGSSGLALALADEGYMSWSTVQTTCAAHTAPFTGGTWKLASKDEWDNMISAAGSYTDLRDGFSSVGGTNMQSSDRYWSSTDSDSGYAWVYNFSNGKWGNGYKDFNYYVRACLAF